MANISLFVTVVLFVVAATNLWMTPISGILTSFWLVCLAGASALVSGLLAMRECKDSREHHETEWLQDGPSLEDMQESWANLSSKAWAKVQSDLRWEKFDGSIQVSTPQEQHDNWMRVLLCEETLYRMVNDLRDLGMVHKDSYIACESHGVSVTVWEEGDGVYATAKKGTAQMTVST